MPIEVDIIGSTATNIQIGYPTGEVNEDCSIDCDGCEPCGGKNAILHHGTISRGLYAIPGVPTSPPGITGCSSIRIKYLQRRD